MRRTRGGKILFLLGDREGRARRVHNQINVEILGLPFGGGSLEIGVPMATHDI